MRNNQKKLDFYKEKKNWMELSEIIPQLYDSVKKGFDLPLSKENISISE